MTRSTPNIPDAADAGNYGRVRHYLSLGESFRHSTMAAYKVPSRGLGADLSDPGRLGGEDFFRWLEDRQNVAYVVWSYVTPVWWVRRDGVTYSAENVGGATTAKHRNLALAWARRYPPEMFEGTAVGEQVLPDVLSDDQVDLRPSFEPEVTL